MNELRRTLALLEQKQQLELDPLRYGLADLDPVWSRDSVNFHYNKLARGYVKRYNAGEGDPDFNEAGAYLHNVLFAQFQEPKSGNRPSGSSLALIESKWDSWDNFKSEFLREAMTIQGSGWVYMSRSGDIKIIKNHQIRRDIALLIDWWEHSYYTDYGPDKPAYLNNIWRIIDWSVVNSRL
jgi:Fe-Mn family superoxide dismutase